MEGFLSPPQTPSLTAAIHLRPLFHDLHDLMAHSQSGIQAMMGRVFLAKKNAIKDFLLRFFSESLQFGDLA